MENSAKALYMAGTLLISLLVISLFVYSYRNWGGVQKQKDKIAQEENITKFNKEYEAFNKRIMYGVDVISCINKAVSNNEKYFKEGRWSLSGASGQEALVQVEVILNDQKPLQESFEVYCINDKDKEVQVHGENSKFNNLTLETMLSSNNKKSPKLTKVNEKSNLTELKNNEYKFNFRKETFKLLDDSKKKFKEDDSSLYDLVNNANDLEITLYRKDNWGLSAEDVTYVKWITCIADFKKRKFKCVSEQLQYNENTGRIEKIVFQEV